MNRCKSLFRPLPIVLALHAAFLSSSYAGDFSIATGETNSSAQTLPTNGVVQSGGTLSTSGTTVAVTIGSGTSNLTNSGTISQTGTGRTIDANAGTPVFTLTNNAGGLITAAGNVAIRLNRTAGSYLIDNQGTIAQTGPAVNGERAIKADAAYTSTDNRIFNGSATNTAAVISSTGNDAIRLGSNFTLTNYGSIYSTGSVNTSCPSYVDTALGCSNDYSAADGVAIENGRQNVVILNYGSISGPRHAVDGGDPVAAVADSDLIGTDQLVVTSTGPNGVTFNKVVNGVTTTGVTIANPVVINYAGGTLTGNNGSGVGLDGHGVVINHGTITGNYAGAGNVFDHEGYGLTTSNGDGDGVDIDGVAYVENWGTIRGTGAGGYDSDGNPNGADGIAAGGGTIINHVSATISGQSKGILIDDGANGSTGAVRGTATANGTTARIYNEGNITGEKKTAIGLVGNFNDILINYGTGVITGGADSVQVDALASTTPAAAIQMGDGDDTLTNYGKIEGKNGLAIDMGIGNDTLKLFNGGTTGIVIGTVAGGMGTDTLETGGTQKFETGTLSGFESYIVRDGSTTFNYGLGSVTSLQVDAGASLQINGDVSTTGNVTLDGSFKGSSTMAPRAIAVGGNLALGASSVVEMRLGPGNTSDKFQVAGSTTFTSGATIRPIANSYVSGGSYALVQGGVFSTPILASDANTATVSYALSNSGADLLLTATRTATMSSLATGGNSGLANTLDALGQSGSSDANQLLGALDSQPNATAFNEALKQIAPDSSGASLQATQVATGTIFSALGSRIDTARSGTLAQAERGLSAGETANRRMWVEGLGAWGEQDSRANSTGYKIGAGGLAFGFEVDRSAREVMGVSAGYTRAKVEGTDSASGDDVRVHGYHMGGYFSRTDNDMTLDALVVLGYNEYDSQRRVVFPGFAETVRGEYQGWSIGGRVEFGLPFSMSTAWSGRWLAGARAGYLGTEGYTEQGSAGAVQRVDGNDATSLQSALGIELTQQISNESQLQLRARYLHEFADSPDIKASFVAGGPSFTSENVKPNRDSLLLGVSYRLATRQGVTFGIGYDAEIKEKYLAHQLTARAVWNF